MKVAVDARELCGKPTGVGRYLSELLREWGEAAEAQRHEWILLAPATAAVPPAFADRVRVLPGGGGTAWEQWTLARGVGNERADVLFAPGYSAPLAAPCPTVVAIHDVSFAARPEWFRRREGARRRMITRWSARRAARILTISEFSKREIIRHLGIAAGRITVTRLGVRRPAIAFGKRDPVVLYVGSIFERRHVETLVDTFVRQVAPKVGDARLEIVGGNRLSSPATLDASLAGAPPEIRARVRFRSYLDDGALQELYGHARVFAFLSEYEGFGLTPLEAIANGVAPIVLDTPVAREAYGPAALYLAFDAGLPETLGRALIGLLTDDRAHSALVAQGAAIVSRYDWSRTAAETLAVIEDAAGAR